VAALQSDGRRSNRDLAQMLGVAPSTTLERVRALRARGVITGFHASTVFDHLQNHIVRPG
jgi:DNA-binding Lrp family transcriptional regulator